MFPTVVVVGSLSAMLELDLEKTSCSWFCLIPNTLCCPGSVHDEGLFIELKSSSTAYLENYLAISGHLNQKDLLTGRRLVR